ncbi:aspartate aminotransferase family protein [Balneolaceae bacterium ANBcel3]|nr:aspartate aminotransferase family protein [Balneolaceae bacterium ANBcel3]
MKEIQELDLKYHFPVYKRLPITLSHGKGARVWDTNGKEYIDVLGGIAVNSLGHGHPALVHAIKNQAEKLVHVSNFYSTVPQAKLTAKLAELSGLDRVFLCSTGLEAMEGAYKTARKYANKQGRKGPILSMEGCFHGRSIAGIASGKKKFQEGFEPMPAGFRQIPFNSKEALSEAVDAQTAAVVIEPVQGEGGVRPADPEFLRHARKVCDEYGVPLIFDEIQTGIARTGRMFAYEHSGVKPDILTLAKGLGGGVPIGAVLAKEEIASALSPGDHGTTFGGNALACAAANAVLQTVEREDLVRQSEEKGAWLMEVLNEKLADHPLVKDIRGIGLMTGAELDIEGGPVVQRMAELGVLANAASVNVMRFVPPLVISKDDLFSAVCILKKVLDEMK